VIRLTRRYPFSASHRLHAASLSADANAELYGKCNNPYGHGHNYVLEVTVAGDVQPRTGRVVDLEKLDQLVRSEVVTPFDHRNLNEDVRDFANVVPTTENLVSVIQTRLKNSWPADFPKLSRIRIFETRKNIFEVQVGV
jgi:6-pyruvoyltetrahydropterin/6-carboxytetrahydropterin synthase